jgi:hypothetical protein
VLMNPMFLFPYCDILASSWLGIKGHCRKLRHLISVTFTQAPIGLIRVDALRPVWWLFSFLFWVHFSKAAPEALSIFGSISISISTVRVSSGYWIPTSCECNLLVMLVTNHGPHFTVIPALITRCYKSNYTFACGQTAAKQSSKWVGKKAIRV